MKDLTLRIATYNLQKCVGLDLRRNPRRVLEVIEDTEAQIVVLQEADKRLPPRPAALPHDMIRAEGWQIVPFGTAQSLGWHGNAMLYRPEGIRVTATDRMDLPGLEPRGAILAEFDTALGPLRVIGTHLGLVARSRRMQCAALRRALEDRAPMPVLIAGDFNAWGSAADLDAELGMVDLLPSPPSYPAPRAVAPLDRFGIGGGLMAGPVTAHRAQPARIASDHLPVTVQIWRRDSDAQ